MNRILKPYEWTLLLCIFAGTLPAGEKYPFDEALVLSVFDLAELREYASKEGLSPFLMKRMREWTTRLNALRPKDPDQEITAEAQREMNVLNRRMQELLSAAKFYSIDYLEETCQRQAHIYRDQRYLINLETLPAEMQEQVKKADAFVAVVKPLAPDRDQLEREKRRKEILTEDRKRLEKTFEYLRERLTKADAEVTELERKLAVMKRDYNDDLRNYEAAGRKLEQMRAHRSKLSVNEQLAYASQYNNELNRAGELHAKFNNTETEAKRLVQSHEHAHKDILETCTKLLELNSQGGYASELFNNPKLITPAEKKWMKPKLPSK